METQHEHTEQAAATALEQGMQPDGAPCDETLFSRVECILFVAGDPVSLSDIGRVLNLSKTQARALLVRMEQAYTNARRGVLPMVTYETVQLVSNREYIADVQTLLQPDEIKNVSQSLLETLAVVAYRQPVTRADIEQVRGVRCDYAVSQLVKLNLIHEVGRRDVVGRPVLFGTTDRFLRQFGIHNITEMPEYLRYSQEIPEEASEEVPV